MPSILGEVMIGLRGSGNELLANTIVGEEREIKGKADLFMREETTEARGGREEGILVPYPQLSASHSRRE